MRRLTRKIVIALMFCGCVGVAGLCLPGTLTIPVLNATRADWNHQTFWAPWGPGRVHKGIDIFAPEGTTVISAAPGVVLYAGHLSLGGHVVLILGPQWRVHYYAHMQKAAVISMQWLSAGEEIGRVGSTGNAAGKPPHLHYSIIRLIPDVRRLERNRHGWERMFYENPHEAFSQNPSG